MPTFIKTQPSWLTQVIQTVPDSEPTRTPFLPLVAQLVLFASEESVPVPQLVPSAAAPARFAAAPVEPLPQVLVWLSGATE